MPSLAKLLTEERLKKRLAGSSCLQRVAQQHGHLRALIDADLRVVIPVAEIARTLGVSVRLVWNWVADGLLRNQTPDHGWQRSKRGITRQRMCQFLDQLKRLHDQRISPYSSKAGRPRTAQSRLLAAVVEQGPAYGKGLTPPAFAALIGVSAATVRRAIARRQMKAYQPSPGRWLMGNRPAKKSGRTGRKK